MDAGQERVNVISSDNKREEKLQNEPVMAQVQEILITKSGITVSNSAPEITTLTPRELLELGRARLIENGWAQGAQRDRYGQVCAAGALIYAVDDSAARDGTFAEVFHKAYKYLSKATPHRFGDVVRANDNIGTVFADVLEWYDKAILAAKEDEAQQ